MQAVERSQIKNPLISTTPRILLSVTLQNPSGHHERLELRRPATLIGSKRHAHIVLRDEQVGRTHAVIINTGVEILLADLLSKAGTLCNGHHTKLKILKDGDRIQVGTHHLVVGIEKPSGSPTIRSGMLGFDDPLKMPRPLRLTRVDTEQYWDAHDSVTVIGSPRAAHFVVEGEHIAPAHSLIFATIHGVGIYDLGSTTTLKVNGREKKFAYLRHQDRLLIGSVGLTVQMLPLEAPPVPSRSSAGPEGAAGPGRHRTGLAHAAVGDTVPHPPASALASLESRIASLQEDLARSWNELDEWKGKLTSQHKNLASREQDLANKEKQLGLLAEALEQRAGEVTKLDQTIAQRDVNLTSQRKQLENQTQQQLAELHRHKIELTQKERDLSARCSELTVLAKELDTRQADVSRGIAELEAQRRSMAEQRRCLNDERESVEAQRREVEALHSSMHKSKSIELEGLQAAIQEERMCIEEDRRSVQRLLEGVEDRSRQLAEREKKTSAEQARLIETEATLEARRRELEQQQILTNRQGQSVQQREEHLRLRDQEMSERQRQLDEQAATVEKLRQFLRQAGTVLDPTSSPSEPGEPTVGA